MSGLVKTLRPSIDKLLPVHDPRNKDIVDVTLCQNRNPIVMLMQLIYAIPFMLMQPIYAIPGITIQIYSTLIAYLILQLIEINQEFGRLFSSRLFELLIL